MPVANSASQPTVVTGASRMSPALRYGGGQDGMAYYHNVIPMHFFKKWIIRIFILLVGTERMFTRGGGGLFMPSVVPLCSGGKSSSVCRELSVVLN